MDYPEKVIGLKRLVFFVKIEKFQTVIVVVILWIKTIQQNIRFLPVIVEIVLWVKTFEQNLAC